MDNLNPKDLTPAESIKEAESLQGKEFISYLDAEFSPVKNPKVMSIMKMEDGNFKIFGQKNGKMIVLRGIKPEDVLTEFLTSQ